MKTEANDAIEPLYRGEDGLYGNYTAGLTKREYYAGLAMQGMVASRGSITNIDTLALTSVKYADALIAALNDK